MDMNSNPMPQRSGGGKGIIIAIVIIIVLIIAIVVWKMKSGSTTPNTSAPVATESNTETQSVQGTSTENTSVAPAPKTVTVSLTNSGFSPASITINAGDTVKFVNNSAGRMWVASNPHPAHTDYPGFDEKSAAGNGESYNFTFDRAGTWGYHNHLNIAEKGTVVVNQVGPAKD
jgi:plastocyanin